MAVLPMARRRGHRLLDAAGGTRGQVQRHGVADLQLRRPPDRQPALLCGPAQGGRAVLVFRITIRFSAGFSCGCCGRLASVAFLADFWPGQSC